MKKVDIDLIGNIVIVFCVELIATIVLSWIAATIVERFASFIVGRINLNDRISEK